MRKLILSTLLFICPLLSFSKDHEGLGFIENKNQWAQPVKYKADLPGGVVFFTPGGFTYNYYSVADLSAIHDQAHNNVDVENAPVRLHAYSMSFSGCNTQTTVSASGIQPYYHNYFLGKDPSKWASRVGIYDQVTYKDLYTGINLKVYSRGTSMKYDFIVSAGADAGKIKMKFTGVTPRLTTEGDLKIETSINTILEKAPYAYQVINGARQQVSCKYHLDEKGELSFVFPKGYDQARELVIDPVLVFATYSGSTAATFGYSAAYDQQGGLYAGGEVFGPGWPTSMGAYQTTFGGAMDVGLNKYDATGATLVYSTYYGGTVASESPSSMIVNSNNELIITGTTGSPDLPMTTGCYDGTHNGMQDIYVAVFNAAGTALLAATFIGGSGTDGSNAFALSPNYGDAHRGDLFIDAVGNITVCASTASFNFPTTAGAFQTTSGGSQDGCVFKLDPTCSILLYSTYLGGSGRDACFAMVPNSNGDIVITGGTVSNNFPVSPGSLHTTIQGGTDGFVVILDANMSSLLYGTYLGTSSYDHAFKVQTDPSDNVYVCGQTKGNYPVTPGVYSNTGGRIFIDMLAPDLSASLASTTLGSANTQYTNLIPSAFFYDVCGNIYFCGNHGNTVPDPNQPLSADAHQTVPGGLWICVLGPGMSTLNYATYMGNLLCHVDGGSSRCDPQGIVYHSVCTGGGLFPTTPGSWSTTPKAAGSDLASFKFNFQVPLVLAAIPGSDKDSICAPGTVQFSNNSTGALSYVWDFGDGSPVSNAVAPTHTYTAPGTYTVSLQAQNPCVPNDTAYLTIYVFDVPVPQLQVSDTVVCEPGILSLSAPVANLNSNMTFSWTPAAAVISDPGQQTVTVDATLSNSFTVTVTDSIEASCKEVVQGTIHIITKDLSSLQAFTDTSICPGDTVMIHAVGGVHYTWIPFYNISDTTLPDVLVYPRQTTTYNVMITDNTGCKASRPVTVTILPDAEIDAGDDQAIQSGQSVYLTATGNISGYLWTPDYKISSVSSPNPKVSPDITTRYYVTGTTAEGCSVTDSVNVVVLNIYIPTAFSPNGDGRNDIFHLLPVNDAVKLLDLSVYNRWGERVFHANNIRDGWDGTYKGKPAESGTYFYTVLYHIGDKSYNEKGDVTLVR